MAESTNDCLYEKIQHDLMAKIQDGTYPPGARIPSELRLAKEYGVSRITAIKALTELSLNGYINRQQGKGSFVNPPNMRFRPSALLATRPPAEVEGTRRIGLMIPEYFDYHSGNIIRGILQTLPYPDYYVTIIISQNEKHEEYALNDLTQQGYAGVLLFPVDSEYYSDIILQMQVNKYPLVLMDRYFPGISCNSVVCDNRAGTSIAIEHLIAHGHEKIVFFADASYQEQITSIRYDSYVKTMIRHNLAMMNYENFFRDEIDSLNHHTFIERVQRGEITAVVASNSHIAVKIANLCKSNHIDIPGQLSIVCFDRPEIGETMTGESFFTYVEQNSMQMGQSAAKLLDAMLRGATESKRIVLEPRLVINASTGTPEACRA